MDATSRASIMKRKVELAYDIARCVPSNPCKLKEKCARFTFKGSPSGFQTYFDASVLIGDCGGFIGNEIDDV